MRLTGRPLDEVFAQRGQREIRVREFLRDVYTLAQQLPPESHLFNLVRDRYDFTVAFAAMLVTGKCNVLPPNAMPAVQEKLAAELPPVAVIHDGIEVAAGLTALSIPLDGAPAAPPAASDAAFNPALDATRLAMVAFTSGSSGAAKPIAKTVGMLRGAAELYEDLLIPRGSSVVETVPPQHMYGLELASLQALWSPVRFTAGKPLFPLEVQQELRLTPAPRVLVTTPLHLRALLESGLEFPALERVLSATAPLDAGLALRAETQLATQLLDVYGCSEAGCMASRRLAKETAWQPFPGLRFEHQAQERTPGTVVHGPHLDEPVPLGDRLHFESDGRFHLQGRLGDLINVAGKRGSLGEITRLLLAVPGVEDAAAFLTDTDRDNQRPAALYTGTASTREIRAHLSRELDPVFIPRPLLRVASLPRTASAKLPRDALLACLEAHRQRP